MAALLPPVSQTVAEDSGEVGKGEAILGCPGSGLLDASVDPRQLDCTKDEEFMALFGDQVRMVAESLRIDESAAARGLMLQEPFGAFMAFAKATATTYGGAWMEWAPSPRLVVSLVGGDEGERDQSFLDQQARLSGLPVEFAGASVSYSDLVAASQIADGMLADAATASVTIDQRYGRLRVTGPEDVVRSLPRNINGVAVEIEVADFSMEGVMPGGWRGECTIGFGVVAPPSVVGGSPRSGVMTAGHCADDAETRGSVTTNAANPAYDWNADPDIDPLQSGNQPNWEYMHGIDYQVFELPLSDTSSNILDVPSVAITRQSLVELPYGAVVLLYGGSGAANCPGRAAINTYLVQGYDSRTNLEIKSAAPMGNDLGRKTVAGDSGGPAYYLDSAVGIVLGGDIDSDDRLPDQSVAPYSPNLCNTDGRTQISRIDNQLTRSPYFVREGSSSASQFDAIGTFHPMLGTRALDTRGGTALAAGGADRSVSLSAAVPSDAGAVLLWIVTVPVSGFGKVVAFPSYPMEWSLPTDTTASPYAASTGVTSGVLTVRTGDLRAIKLRAIGSGSTHVVVDVLGYYSRATGSQPLGNGTVYRSLSPSRVFDSRYTVYGHVPLGPGAEYVINLNGFGSGNPIPNIAGVVAVLNVTAVNPSAQTYLTVYKDGTTRPGISQLNAVAGDNVGKYVAVQPSASGNIRIYNGAGNTDVIVDVVGYFRPPPTGAALGRTSFSTPTRVFAGSVPGTSQSSSPVQVLTLPYTDPIGPKAGVTAVVVNITATGFATGWLTAYGPWGSTVPATSTLNYNQYETESNLAIIEVNDFTQGAIAIKNGGTSSTYVTVDVVGYVLSG